MLQYYLNNSASAAHRVIEMVVRFNVDAWVSALKVKGQTEAREVHRGIYATEEEEAAEER